MACPALILSHISARLSSERANQAPVFAASLDEGETMQLFDDWRDAPSVIHVGVYTEGRRVKLTRKNYGLSSRCLEGDA